MRLVSQSLKAKWIISSQLFKVGKERRLNEITKLVDINHDEQLYQRALLRTHNLDCVLFYNN